jgi:hypothetical protein
MSQHDQVLNQIRNLLQTETVDRNVSGYTGHYLPNGKYFYVGTPKADGPVRITTNVLLPDRQPKWMPRGSVRSAFMSTDQEGILLMVEGLLDSNVQAPARKTPAPKATTPASGTVVYSEDEILKTLGV